jgi:type VI secretion system secreted protein VgrG
MEPPTAKIETPAVCTITIDNRQIQQKVSSVQLDQHIDDHHELQIRVKQVGTARSDRDFDDPGDYTGFLGKSVGMKITPGGGIVAAARELEFVGLVTEIRLENSIDGLNTVLITAKSPTITFDGAPKIALFENQKASDTIGAIVANYPITRGTIEASDATIDYSVQYRESDYQYIMRLAEESGLFSFYDGKEYRLQKSNGSSSEELVWRESLGSFAMGLGTAPSKYGARTWDYVNKSDLSGQVDTGGLRSSPSDMPKISIDASKKLYDSAGQEPAHKAPDQARLDAAITRKVESQVGQMVSCVGESIVPAVKVGHCIKVKGMGKLDGVFWVTAVNHVFDESGKYHNRLVCSPLDASFPARRATRPLLTNLQSALVTALDDPDKMGRIKVQVPALGIDSHWVRFMQPHAGDKHGWVCMPEIDDEVLLGYENGDPDLPVALGCFYNGKATTSITPDNKNDIKVFLTRGGNEIRFTDTSGQEEISISTQNGKNQIVLNMQKPSISVKSQGDITIEADGDVTIKGNNVTVESQTKLDIKSSADTSIQATGKLTAKGTAGVDVEASAICNIKGAMINLN